MVTSIFNTISDKIDIQYCSNYVYIIVIFYHGHPNKAILPRL